MQKLYSYPLFLCFILCVLISQNLSAQSPTIASFTPATGPVGSLVTITGTNLSSPTFLKIGGVAAIAVSNSGSSLVAMVMPGAVTGSVTVVTAKGTVTAGGSFTVSATKAPNTQQGNKLVGSGTVGGYPFEGSALAISADGNTAIVGGSGDNNDAGAAWIFTRSKGAWSQQGKKLVGSNAVYVGRGAAQGVSVAISADGNTVAIGGYGDNGGVGAVWVFTRNSGVWSQQGDKFVGNDAVDNPNPAYQGSSLSMSADGNSLIEGGFGDNNYTGAAWVFTRSNGVWSQQGSKLVGAGGGTTDTQQGVSVAMSANGSTVAVGGTADSNGEISGVGAVWVFTEQNGVWSQQGNKLVGSGADNQQYGSNQGSSLSISADGNTLISGASNDSTGYGAAWVFTRRNGTWSQQGSKLVGTGAINGTYGILQGTSVSVSADGNIAIIGGSQDNNGAGAVWVFTRTGSAWAEAAHNKLVGTGAANVNYGANQGNSVSISADGSTVIIGGWQDNNNLGAAWVFTYVPIATPAISAFSPQSGPVGTLITITGSNLNNLVTVNIGGVNALPISSTGGQLVAFVMPGAATGSVSVTTYGGTVNATGNFTVTSSKAPNSQQGAKLVSKDTAGAAAQGQSVAVSADGNTAIVGGFSDNNRVGAAWVFTRSNGIWSQQGGKLVGSGAVGAASQGWSVAISADGNTVIESGVTDNGNVGAAWIFTRSNGVWTQQGAKLSATDAVGSVKQGSVVSMSADGNTVVINAPSDNNHTGAIWVYARLNGVWAQQGSKLTDVSGGYTSNESLGSSVSISADGNTIIAGASGYVNGGGAWIFTNSGGIWTQQGSVLQGSQGSGSNPNYSSYQGTSVAISADGNTCIVGGRGDNNDTGAAWIFVRSQGAWSQQGNKLVGSGVENPFFGAVFEGIAVAMSADGNTVIIGGYDDNNGAGASWVFTRSNGVWMQQGKKLVGSGAVNGDYGANQASSVCISADGNTAMAGGYNDNGADGAAWVFTNAATLPVTFRDFTAYALGKGVQTAWTGYDETGITGYEVERSTNDLRFGKIGYAEAKAASLENSYIWFDANPLAGDNYYRIKAISKDGEIQYSNIVKVSLGNGKSSMQVYPNPVTGRTIQLKLNNVDAGSYTLTVYTMSGQKLLTQNYQHTGGDASVSLKVKNAAAGLYLVEIKGTNITYRTSVLVE